jgi:hypothetical protein
LERIVLEIGRERKFPAKPTLDLRQRRWPSAGVDFSAADTASAIGASGLPGEVFAGRATGPSGETLPDF